MVNRNPGPQLCVSMSWESFLSAILWNVFFFCALYIIQTQVLISKQKLVMSAGKYKHIYRKQIQNIWNYG